MKLTLIILVIFKMLYEADGNGIFPTKVKKNDKIAILAWKRPVSSNADYRKIWLVLREKTSKWERGAVRMLPEINIEENKPVNVWIPSYRIWRTVDDEYFYEVQSDKDITDWDFKIGVITPSDDPEKDAKLLTADLELNQEIDDKFCTSWYSEDRIIFGKTCPIDPKTNKEMEVCLNFRRRDEIGNLCMLKLSKETKNNAIEHFCLVHKDAADCRCMNRLSYPEYLKGKKRHGDNDYCWYPPCASGAYAKLDMDLKCSPPTIQTNFDIVGKGPISLKNINVKPKVSLNGGKDNNKITSEVNIDVDTDGSVDLKNVDITPDLTKPSNNVPDVNVDPPIRKKFLNGYNILLISLAGFFIIILIFTRKKEE